MQDKELNQYLWEVALKVHKTNLQWRKKFFIATSDKKKEQLRELCAQSGRISGLLFALERINSAISDLEVWEVAEEDIKSELQKCAVLLCDKINELIKKPPRR